MAAGCNRLPATATCSRRCLGAHHPQQLRSPATSRSLQQRRGSRVLRAQEADGASSSDGAASSPSSSNGTSSSNGASGSDGSTEEFINNITMPKIGFFSLADPNAEVYSKAGEVFDPQKKGGRYKPEFIWNTNWQEALQRQEDLERQQKEYQQAVAEGRAGDAAVGPGVLSFSRLADLNDMSIDLTEQLLRKQPSTASSSSSTTTSSSSTTTSSSSSGSSSSMQDAQGRQARTARPLRKQQQNALPPARPARQRAAAAAAASPSYEFKDLPTRGEAKRFNRATRSAIRNAPTTTLGAIGQLPPEEAAKRQRIKEAERVRYEALKVEFQQWTLAMGLLGCVTAYTAYSHDTAVSYALGSVAGLAYLRLLSRSIDAVGEGSMGAALSGAGGQPRLLIPVMLALSYNRWNVLYAASTGVTLQLLPMLVGFFTYKFAVLGRQGLALLKEISDGSSGSGSSSGDGSSADGEGGGGDGEEGGSMSLDRIFVRRALSE